MRRAAAFSLALAGVNLAIFLAAEGLSGWYLARTTPLSASGRTVPFAVDPQVFWRPEDFYERLARFKAGHPAHVVLSLGDSVTMGLDVRPGRDYSALLEHCLQERAGTGWSVLNLGVEGYSTLQNRRLLARVAPELAPEVVVLLAGWNDHWKDGWVPDAEIGETALRFRALALRFRTGRLIDRLLLRRAGDDSRHVTRVPLPEFTRNLEAIEAYCRERRARLVLILPVYFEPGLHAAGFQDLHEGYVEAMRTVAAERGGAVVDLIQRFRNDSDLFTPDDAFARPGLPAVDYVHPSEAGQALLGQELCRVVRSAQAPPP